MVKRTAKPQDKTPDLFDGKRVYRTILTNDWDAEEEEFIDFYNQHGVK